MVKLVVLLDSEALQQGWRVILSIGEECLQASSDLLEKTTPPVSVYYLPNDGFIWQYIHCAN
jgi:hypothetical protein